MKVLKVVIVGAAAFSASILQAKNYGTAGCGLGSVVFGEKPGMIQILAATTNGTSASQTFGITSGTSNCVSASKTAAILRQEEFVVANMPALSKDVAKGEGQVLAGFSSTLGCNEADMAAVSRTLQDNHDRIFSAPGAVATLNAAKEALRSNSATAGGCTLI